MTLRYKHLQYNFCSGEDTTNTQGAAYIASGLKGTLNTAYVPVRIKHTPVQLMCVPIRI
jgi:hypothetical protein